MLNEKIIKVLIIPVDNLNVAGCMDASTRTGRDFGALSKEAWLDQGNDQ